MYEKLVEKYLKLKVTEAKEAKGHPGITITNDVKAKDKKINDDATKETEKKMKEYDKNSGKKDKDAIVPPKVNIEDETKKYHEEIEMSEDSLDLTYDVEGGVSDRFKDRAKKAVEGDSTMGNKVYTGKDNGNTESTWGASKNDYGKDLVKTKIARAKDVSQKPKVGGGTNGKQLGITSQETALTKKGPEKGATTLFTTKKKDATTEGIDRLTRELLEARNPELGKYTHYAVNYKDGKIYNGWDYQGLDDESIKFYAKLDLADRDLNPSEFKVVGKKRLNQLTINPADDKNWANPGMSAPNESAEPTQPLTEAVSDKNKMVLTKWVDTLGAKEAAVKLINTLSQTGLVSDLPDTMQYGQGLNRIEALLSKKNFEMAVSSARKLASSLEKKAMKDMGESTNNNNNQQIIENKMKRLKFKKPFDGMKNALNVIPETYKVDNKVFELADGNETYKVRWEGSLTEGKAVVLQASNKQFISEDVSKIKHLMWYKSEETLGTVKGNARLDEEVKFKELNDKMKVIAEEKEAEKKN